MTDRDDTLQLELGFLVLLPEIRALLTHLASVEIRLGAQGVELALLGHQLVALGLDEVEDQVGAHERGAPERAHADGDVGGIHDASPLLDGLLDALHAVDVLLLVVEEGLGLHLHLSRQLKEVARRGDLVGILSSTLFLVVLTRGDDLRHAGKGQRSMRETTERRTLRREGAGSERKEMPEEMGSGATLH
jgi:hypothetical protein